MGRERGTSEGTCRSLVLVLALEEAPGPCVPHPRTSAVPKGSALGMDPKVKEAQERNSSSSKPSREYRWEDRFVAPDLDFLPSDAGQ